MMRLCFEKIDAGGEDAQFFQGVHDALLEGRHESEMIGRLDEARVWPAKWWAGLLSFEKRKFRTPTLS
jgi:hypothetical protein